MQQGDYEAISKIIENVIGKDTLSCIKILEGLKFYLDNKTEKIRVIKTHSNIMYSDNNKPSIFKKDAVKAMTRYTAKLKEDVAKYKKQKKNCSINS